MDGKIPDWARDYFNDTDFVNVENAVAEAERRTDGEIVPMVVESSTPMWPTRVIMVLVMAVIALILNDIFSISGLGAILMNVVAWMIGLRLGFVPWLHRLIVPKVWMNAEVANRAELEFYRARLNHTERKTGIIVFISLLEHRVMVMGDQAISSKIPQEAWGELVKTIVEGIRDRRAGEGLAKAIARCGDILSAHFPVTPNDVNELANHLVFKE